MRTVFVYEFLTGGGCWSLGNEPPTGSLLTEGRAMRDAIAADFAACEDVQTVHLLHDERLPEPQISKQRLHAVESPRHESELISQLASISDATLVIAPEFSHLLLYRVLRVESVGRLISPRQEVVRLASDKARTANYLEARGIVVPLGINFCGQAPPVDGAFFPAVLKPIDGAGSLDVQYLENKESLPRHRAGGSWRLEKFHPGTAASAAFLSGPNGFLPLPPCAQHLTADGQFKYLGGSTPLHSDLAERATRLANQVAGALPPFRGYLGIDMILGPANNGSDDVVIEINPRLTTSYLGLRAACHQNLAKVMWKWALGEPIPPLTFRDETIEFTADGNLRIYP